MIVLDTNSVSLFQYPDDERAIALRERLAESSDRDIVITAEVRWGSSFPIVSRFSQ